MSNKMTLEQRKEELIGKIIKGRKILDVYYGSNIFGRETLMVKYKHLMEDDNVEPLRCAFNTLF